MTKIFVCISLLSALSIVEVKTLSVEGRVGKDVTFTCSNWRAWSNVQENVKYLCHSPCTEDKHIIIKAASEKTTSKDRIQITNTAGDLFVTFTNLKMSDSKKYYCGVERFGRDRFIEVNLKVIDAELPVPKTSVKPVTVGPTVSSAVTNSSTVSSSNNITTDMPVVNSTSSDHVNSQTMQGPESLLYLIIGFVAALVTLMVLLTLMRSVKRQQKVVSSASSPHEVTQGDAVYEDIDLEAQHTESQPVGASTYPSSAASAGVDPDSLYANYAYLQDISARSKSRDTDVSSEVVYSFAEHPKKKTELNGQSENYDNDYLYSLAQPPQAT